MMIAEASRLVRAGKTTWQSALLRNHVPAEDATIVKLLRAAGAGDAAGLMMGAMGADTGGSIAGLRVGGVQ